MPDALVLTAEDLAAAAERAHVAVKSGRKHKKRKAEEAANGDSDSDTHSDLCFHFK